jgi:uncharacterized membrane protein
LQTLAFETDVAVSYLPTSEQDATRHLVSRQLIKLQRKHTYEHNHNLHAKQEQHILRSIKTKLNLNNATIIKADKGNTLVVMYLQQ